MRAGLNNTFQQLSKLCLVLLMGFGPTAVHAEKLKLRTGKLTQQIIVSDSGNLSQGNSGQSSLGRKLDWVSDTITNRRDLFIQSPSFDNLADDPAYGRRMLRRATVKEASRLVRESELKPIYRKFSDFFKQAQEVFTVKEDLSTGSTVKSSGVRSGKKVLSLGLDSGNSLSPTITIFDNIKLAYEPFNNGVSTRIDLDF